MSLKNSSLYRTYKNLTEICVIIHLIWLSLPKTIGAQMYVKDKIRCEKFDEWSNEEWSANTEAVAEVRVKIATGRRLQI